MMFRLEVQPKTGWSEKKLQRAPYILGKMQSFEKYFKVSAIYMIFIIFFFLVKKVLFVVFWSVRPD